jgi:predicted short-subunit dehydrogenase-like oxidoreductase (DUF2520 family)
MYAYPGGAAAKRPSPPAIILVTAPRSRRFLGNTIHMVSCRVRTPRLCIVGPGRLGSALAVALHAAGYPVAEIITRDSRESLRKARVLAKSVNARVSTIADGDFDCEVVWICVPDAQIEAVAAGLATDQTATSASHPDNRKDGACSGAWPRSLGSPRSSQREGRRARRNEIWRRKTVFHASGALTSERLSPLASLGAAVASVHPMMTFVLGSRPSLAGVSFAVEGHAKAARVAKGIVRGLKGVLVNIAAADKPLYHAWGAFASPLIISLLATADRIASELGLSAIQGRQTIAPILRQTIENYIAHGPAAAFSGPLVRGDSETVRAHLLELSRVGGAKDVYLALANAAIKSLPVANREEIKRMLSTGREVKNAAGSERHSLKIGGIIQPY